MARAIQGPSSRAGGPVAQGRARARAVRRGQDGRCARSHEDKALPSESGSVADVARWSSTYKVSMHQEGVRADQAVDFDVDLSMTLGDFLRGKRIVEFPVFRVRQ